MQQKKHFRFDNRALCAMHAVVITTERGASTADLQSNKAALVTSLATHMLCPPELTKPWS